MENKINKNIINTKKYGTWCEMLLSIMELTKELNKDEKRYILNNVIIGLSLGDLQELKENSNLKY